MIPQKPITNYKEIGLRIMKYLFGREGRGWDRNSPAWKSWMTYSRIHFRELKKMQWMAIYALAKKRLEED
jgi:hypothetical protein